MEIYDKNFDEKMFLKIFQKIEFFQKNAGNMSNTFSR